MNSETQKMRVELREAAWMVLFFVAVAAFIGIFIFAAMKGGLIGCVLHVLMGIGVISTRLPPFPTE